MYNQYCVCPKNSKCSSAQTGKNDVTTGKSAQFSVFFGRNFWKITCYRRFFWEIKCSKYFVSVTFCENCSAQKGLWRVMRTLGRISTVLQLVGWSSRMFLFSFETIVTYTHIDRSTNSTLWQPSYMMSPWIHLMLNSASWYPSSGKQIIHLNYFSGCIIPSSLFEPVS